MIDLAADTAPFALASPAPGGGGSINGTPGDDILSGTNAADVMIGKDGDDVLSGLGGGDALFGGQGDDTLAGGSGDDTLFGGSGLDSMDGGSGDDLIYAAPDAMNLGALGETLDGGSGVDTISFLFAKGEVEIFIDDDLPQMNFTHFENITGGDFGDTLRGNQKSQVLDGGGGDDNIRGGQSHDKSQSDTLIGGDGNDLLDGGKHGDLLQGGSGDDLIIANFGPDTVEGGDGQDRISLGLDGTMATGGAGADIFNFFGAVNGGSLGTSLITDLEDQDQIDLHRIDADVTTLGNQAFVIVASLDGHAGQAALVYDSGTDVTHLELDTDGDGTADQTIDLSGDHTGFSNFVL